MLVHLEKPKLTLWEFYVNVTHKYLLIHVIKFRLLYWIFFAFSFGQGLYWSLSCIWLLYDGVKIPHLKGESYTGNSSYAPLYTNYMPVEFFISGIVSGLLTVVNVICIFITAIIVLKIKEVAAPYTSSPDLRRYWIILVL